MSETIASFQIERDPWGRLVLTLPDGVEHLGVEPARAFPISDPERWVSLCDAEGHELACIEDLSQLAPETRALLEDELAHREFMPVVEQVLSVISDTDPAKWHVVTDRGEIHFLLAGDDDVRLLGPHRVLVIDTHGVRYLIPDARKLDATSLRMLDRYL